MKTNINSAILAFAVLVGVSVGQAQADDTVWHFPYKAARYGTHSLPAQQVAPTQVTRHGHHVHVKMAGKQR